ncbi:MAG: hypothetical protein WAT91_17220 [Saprospiraceae bacterium]
MRKLSLYFIIVLFSFTGLAHFIWVKFFLAIMPPWIPWQKGLVYVSGGIELACALLLIFHSTRRFAAWSLIALLIAVFPANIQMAINYLHEHNPHLWIAIIRLPFQPLLIWWAYQFTKPRN